MLRATRLVCLIWLVVGCMNLHADEPSVEVRIDPQVVYASDTLMELEVWFRPTGEQKNPPGVIQIVREGSERPAVERSVDWPKYSGRNYAICRLDPSLDLEPGAYTATVRLSAEDGQQLCEGEAHFVRLAGEAPRRTVEATVAWDGLLQIDGRRIWPVVLLSSGVWNEATAKEIADAGFNAVSLSWTAFVGVPKETWQWMDHLYNHGLYIICENSSRIERTSLDDFTRRLRTYSRHPGVIGWHILDEPKDGNNYTHWQAETVGRLIKVYAPGDLRLMADYRAYREYSRHVDVLQTCLYNMIEGEPYARPGAPDMPHKVARPIDTIRTQITEAKRSVAPGTAVWLFCQAFGGWGMYKVPTEDQIRASCYMAIAAGADGVNFFEHHGARQAGIWPAVKRVASELHALQPALVEGRPVEVQGPQGLTLWARRVGDDLYILAVNGEWEDSEGLWHAVDREISVVVPQEYENAKLQRLFSDDQSASLSGPLVRDTLRCREARAYRLTAAE